MITVKFNEAVDVSSVIDTSNWRLNLGCGFAGLLW